MLGLALVPDGGRAWPARASARAGSCAWCSSLSPQRPGAHWQSREREAKQTSEGQSTGAAPWENGGAWLSSNLQGTWGGTGLAGVCLALGCPGPRAPDSGLPPTVLVSLQPPAQRPPEPHGGLQRRLPLPARALQPRVRLRRHPVLLALPRGLPRRGNRPRWPEGEWPRPTLALGPGRPQPAAHQHCRGAPQVYRGCSCVPASISAGSGHATEGKCTSACQSKALLLALVFLVILFTFLSSIPALTATLR